MASSEIRGAIEILEKDIDHASATGDRAGEIRASESLGIAYFTAGEREKATELFQKHLDLAQKAGDQSALARAYGLLGVAYGSLGEFRKAAEVLEKDLAMARSTEDCAREVAACGHLSNAYKSLGDHRKMIEMQERLVEIAREAGDLASLSRAYENIGVAHHSLGEYKKAAEMFQKDLEIAREIGDRKREGRACGNVGVALKSLGGYKEAAEMHEKHLEIARETGNRSGEGEALGNLGVVYQWLGQYRKAIEMQDKALQIAMEAEDLPGVGRAYGNLGVAYQFLGDYRRAIEMQEEILKIARETGNRGWEGAVYSNLGNAYRSLGEYRTAVAMHEKSLHIAVETGDRGAEGKALGNLGGAYYNLDSYKKAIEVQQRRLEIARETADRGSEGAAYGYLGIAYLALGDHRRAIALHEKDLEIALETGDRGRQGEAYGHLGNAYFALEEYSTTIEMEERHVEIARETGNIAMLGNGLHNIGCAHEALRQYEEAMQAAWAGLVKMHQVEKGLGEGQDALRRSLFQARSINYELIQRLLLSMDRPHLALAVSEMSKARGLTHLLLGDAMYSTEGQGDVQALACAEKEWESLCETVRSVGCTVVAYSFTSDDRLVVWVMAPDGTLKCWKELEMGGGGGEGSGKGELQALLMVVEGAFEMGRGDEGLGGGEGGQESCQAEGMTEWAALLAEEGAVDSAGWARLGKMKCSAEGWGRLLERAAASLSSCSPLSASTSPSSSSPAGQRADSMHRHPVHRGVLQGGDAGLARRLQAMPELVLRELHRRLLTPIADALQGADEVVVVPHRDLFRVPWAALLDASGVHWIQRQAVRAAPSLRVAHAAQQRRGASKVQADGSGGAGAQRAVVVGNPWPTASGYSELPYAVEEARGVQQRLEEAGFEVQLLVREAASPSALKASAHGVAWVHLACHGQVRSETGEWGEDVSQHLLLAREQSSQGELSPQEVEEMALLPGATVVLSCCQSGLGQMTGEGVIGLSRALFTAGAGALLVAVCKIPDRAAAELVQRVYRHHLQNGRSLAVAMRAAVLDLAELQACAGADQAASARQVGGGQQTEEAGLPKEAMRGRKGVDMVRPQEAQALHWRAWGGFLVVG